LSEPRVPSPDPITRVAPLGLRFWDGAMRRLVSEGLSVIGYFESDPSQRIPATLNRSDAFVLQNLPWMRATENGAGDDDYWRTHPPSRRIIIEVEDQLRRFVPFSFPARVPTRGFFAFTCDAWGSPPPLPPIAAVPLFSSVTRPVGVELATVRAALFDPGLNAPAAAAVLEARRGGQLIATGIAGEDGQVVLHFAWPEAAATGVEPTLSPVGPVDPPLTQDEWTLTLRARYVRRPTTLAPRDLCETLGQPQANLWADTTLTTPLGDVSLTWGREVIVRSTNSATAQPMAQVLVTPV
jgi:hypothetical protein